RGKRLSLIVGGALIAAVAVGRLLAVPVLGWRLGWLIGAGLVAAGLVIDAAREALRAGLPAACANVAAFRTVVPRPWRIDIAVLWSLAHALALAACFVAIRLPAWYAGVVVALVLGLGVLGLRRAAPAALTPLLAAEGVAIARAALGALGGSGTALPQPWESVLNLPLATWVACGYALLVVLRVALRQRAANVLGSLAIAAALGWTVWLGATLAARGVSGSDPYAYAQMGVDLATRGTVYHRFPLMRLTYELGIPSEPIPHIGYREPTDAGRESTTVWPPGYAAFTGAAYALAGEGGLYAITPLFGLLALLVVAALARTVGPPGAPGVWMTGLAVVLTALSYQQVEWQLIPMADLAAQAFSLLALVVALRGRGWPAALLAGLCVGIAFDVRYTQVLIAPAVALAVAWRAADRRGALRGVFAAGVGAALAALPVLLYHATAFGSPFATGSDELKHFSLGGMPATAARLFSELVWYREFGLLLPLIVIGAVWLWRARRPAALVLTAYALPVLGFHLAYAYLRQRDLLSIFPLGALAAALGAGWLAGRLRSARVPALAAFAGLFVLAYGLAYRGIETLQLPLTRGFSAFGHLVPAQRASFDTIRALTPADAVIAGSLNSGAIDLYAQRQAVRPASWTADQLTAFAEALQREKVPFFILDESNELQPALAALRARYTLREVAALDLPYYFLPGGGSENRRVPLYRVEAR
ncbi:MAG: hypothetical protein K1X39_11755, partial [Thermoflexales bacterium]|nr:hypothetical protein [Thermoflexales bacterium]